ncbi:MAG TPA: protein kinase, partial [Polyangiaceae bacterium]|nr:protein kinase [Polyangiaceae bacterium]
MKACGHCKLKYPNDSSVCFLCGGALEIIQDPLIGTTVAGRYVLGDVIGEGGMATVYAAQHRLVDRPCAIKVMNAGFAKNEVVRERFRREAKAAQKLAHPNIIEIFDQGEMPDGCLYLVMELLQGETVAELVARGPIGAERTIHIAVQIARGLARAHDLEVIHRDLKPENLFLATASVESELVKILDFGIARSMQDSRLTGAGEIFGTPQYMAPERITSIDAGPSADLYALGVILYEMLSGQLPFEAPDIATFFIKHMKELPAPLRTRVPDVPPLLEKLVMELLEKEPKARPVDAHRVHSDLIDIASALQLRLPREVTVGGEASRGPAKTLPPLAIDQWVERTLLFERMLQTAFPRGEPRLGDVLSEVKRLVQEIGELRSRAIEEQRALETTEAKGRDLRQRFGHAVDALGVDASRARDELKLAVTRCEHLKEEADRPRERLKSTLPDILLWEGRSGFHAPFPELGAAYRSAADHADEWLALQRQVTQGEAELTRFRSEVDDLEFQIKELRAALAKHEEQ